MKNVGRRTQNSKLRTHNSVQVSAGLIFREGKLLITRRPAGGHLAGRWEFPGGKREPGETLTQCLARELREELGIKVRIGRCVERVTHTYPGKTVRLRFFRCYGLRGEPRALGCPEFKWVDAEGLGRHRFPEADARLVERLRRSSRWWR
jgi:mutator protein MutT